jgi:two-component system sensor histidine kinase/response regulator
VIFRETLRNVHLHGDRIFAVLMSVQWLGAIVTAIWISPRAWEGAESRLHPHVWAAIFIGGVITAFPVALALARPGEVLTRHAIAIGEGLMSALLIHLTGGRIETHFHIFIALAFLSFYRDWRVLVSATAVVGIDHFLRGYFWPLSIYGVDVVQPLRFVEHGGWILFEDFVLMISIKEGLRQTWKIARQQARLESVNTEIEQQVASRTAQLVEARETALAASQAKSEFLSSMSHEIRTPMTAILGVEELLQDTVLNEEQRNYLEIMKNNSDSLLALINNILDLAKVESGHLVLEHVALDLEDVVEKSIEIFGFRAHAKKLELAARILPDVPKWVIGDPLRVRQILLNLIGNALKFTERGEIVITVGHDESSTAPGTLHFTVTDTGIGIPANKLKEIFSDFSQVDASTTRRYGGSGLGLAIVKRLVELMGGRIWVESTVGRGSTFHFTAAFEIASAEMLRAEPASSEVDFHAMRVLVVDDNQFNRLVLREMLARAGAEVIEAEGGPEALRLCDAARNQDRPFDLILLDCRMPEMDGFEVAERVGGAHRPIVVMLTSDDMKSQLAQVREHRLDAYLVKPVRRAELFNAIGVAINGRDPIGKRHSEHSPVEAGAQSGSAGTAVAPRILIVDDSADNRLLVRAFLKGTGYEIDEAINGMFAVEKFRTGTYNAILMDMRMPVMDGLEATRAIRQIEREQNLTRTPIIALTASALVEDEQRTQEAGADTHVSKPVRKAVLLQAIAQFVEKPLDALPSIRSEVPKAVA